MKFVAKLKLELCRPIRGYLSVIVEIRVAFEGSPLADFRKTLRVDQIAGPAGHDRFRFQQPVRSSNDRYYFFTP